MYLLYRQPRSRTFNEAQSADRFIDDFWYLVYIIFILCHAIMRLLGTAPALPPGTNRATVFNLILYVSVFGETGKGNFATGRGAYRHITSHQSKE